MVLNAETIASILAKSEEARMAVAEALYPFALKEHREELGFGKAANAAAILVGLGIKTTNAGFAYIRYALEDVLPNDERELDSIQLTKVVYPAVGLEYKTSAINVEKAIRQAILNAWEKPKTPEIKAEQVAIFPLGRPKAGALLIVLKRMMINNKI